MLQSREAAQGVTKKELCDFSGNREIEGGKDVGVGGGCLRLPSL